MDHDTLEAKIKPMSSVQTDDSTPQPMDIGEMEYNDDNQYVEAVGTRMTMMIRREARISPASKTPFKHINNDFAFTITYSDVVAKYLLRHPVDGLDSAERVSNSLSCRAAFSSTGPSSQRRRGHNGDALASDSVNVVPPFLRAVNVSLQAHQFIARHVGKAKEKVRRTDLAGRAAETTVRGHVRRATSKGQKGFGQGDDRNKEQKGSHRVQLLGSCWTCGSNHLSRECPKGDGGGGKDHGKAIRCFNCGGVRHRAAQCPTSVWRVEWEEEGSSVRRRRRMRRRRTDDGRRTTEDGEQRRRRTEGTATLSVSRSVGTCSGWRRACGSSAATSGGVCPRRRRGLLAGSSLQWECQFQETEEETRRPGQ